MAVFHWFDGNQGIWGYNNITRYYQHTSDTYSGKGSDGTITLDWKGATTFLRTSFAWQIELDFEDGYKKSEVFRRGTVTEIRYLNTDGDVIVQVEDLDLPLGAVSSFFAAENNELWPFITSGDDVFHGSNDSSGPDSDWGGDDIKTGAGNDIVYGNGSGDYLSDGGGADTYYGGNKKKDNSTSDTLSYMEYFWDPYVWSSGREVTGIVARMDKGRVEGPDGYTDKIFGIDGIRGTFLDDRFIGDEGDNYFYGLGGLDYYDGKEGFDTLRFDRDDRQGGEDGVTVDFNKGKAVDSFGLTEKFQNMEAAHGTDNDDTFISNAQGNYLKGNDGDDVFTVGKNARKQVDILNGGDGADEFIIRTTGFRRVEIEDFDIGDDTLEIVSLQKKKDVSFEDDGEGNLLITFKGNEILLTGVAVGDFGFGDLG